MFIVGLAVYATTTIGDPIIVGTDLTVTSGARIGVDTGSTHITELGDGTLFVEGDAEFDGTVFFDRKVAIHQGEGTAEPATELSVIGTASISEDLWASGSFQFAGGEGVATASYSRLGGTATGHGLSNANDLLINGSLEVDGTAFFDGVVSVSDANGIQIGGGATITTVAASPSCTSCVVGSLFIDTTNATIHMCDAIDTCTLMQKD